MKHHYFHKAVMKAYEEILPADHYPSYFLFFETSPSSIDINIHPTKTEIKFEDERSVWHILSAAVKEAIGKNNLAPTLDFSKEGVIDIPVLSKDQEIYIPKENINREFNPFETDEEKAFNYTRQKIDPDWQKIYEAKRNDDLSPGLGFDEAAGPKQEKFARYLQLRNKYILSPVKSGLMLIDQRRAHERILYEQYFESLKKGAVIAQNSLFPENIDLGPADYQLCLELSEEIGSLGFDIRDFGKNCVIVHSVPANAKIHDIKSVIETILEQYKNLNDELKLDQHEKLARSAAIAAAIPYGKQLDIREMQEIVDQLFACSNPNSTPSGKRILNIVKIEDLERYLA